MGPVLARLTPVSAAGVVLLIVLAGWFSLSSQHQKLKAQSLELAGTEQAIQQSKLASSAQTVVEPNFTQRLPQREAIQQIVRFLGTLAQQHQVTLGQLTLTHASSSEQSLGRVDIAMSMSGPYAGGKQVLSELLSRYPSLGVQSVTAVPRPSDAGRIDWSVSMSLYVKD